MAARIKRRASMTKNNKSAVQFAVSEDEKEALKASTIGFVAKLANAGGWEGLAKQTLVGKDTEAVMRSAAEDLTARCILQGDGLMSMFQWEEAKSFFKLVLQIDPMSDAGMEGLERASDNALATSTSDKSIWAKVYDAEYDEEAKTQFYRIEYYDKSKGEGPFSTTRRRYSEWDRLKKALSKSLPVVEMIEFPSKKFNLRGAKIGKGGITRSSNSEKSGTERTALFNTWLNGVLSVPGGLEALEVRIFLGLSSEGVGGLGELGGSDEDEEDDEDAAEREKIATMQAELRQQRDLMEAVVEVPEPEPEADELTATNGASRALPPPPQCLSLCPPRTGALIT